MTTIEKAARAIAAEWYCETGHDPEAVAAAEGQWKAFESLARAALQAIREPDEKMFDAGQQNPSVEGRPLWKCTTDVQAAVRFTAMIDAILSESA